MMFKLSTSTLLLILIVVQIFLDCIAKPVCDPCRSPYGEKRSTLEAIPKLDARTVYNPRIISPGANTEWVVGSTVSVTWDTSDIPSDATNTNGKVVLGYLQGNSENEHLCKFYTLADGFDIHQGEVHVDVPRVTPRKDYIIVLFGDSGNRSARFTISSF
ncbi:hypothetical protein AMATHDRAFT_187885 [Amanita thiersii Skay4041]|uniref:Yeast cell wall synthesis Kre9/Knh1-like N-terminal domain-containing protein n=1 Tax=Amanita thiersii Skay4041 TaxID=703135 RepID=A0A2A9NZ18_9AGAR|nr:hypothetical protein AMATHDRAFT_187885 [Amanita thiersii Skay4041]